MPLRTDRGAAFLDKNQEMWSSQALDSRRQNLFRTVLRLEVGLFNSAYDASSKRNVLGNMPYELPLPRGDHDHSIRKEREWRRLLGLDSENDNANEDGSRTREL